MPLKYVANKVKRFFIYRVLSLDDTPHRIALGVAVGMFVTWTPTIPCQMVLTIAISALLRANKFVGVPFVWISNPLTLVPVYGPNYLLGAWVLGGRYTWGHFMAAMKQAGEFAVEGSWVEVFLAKAHAYWEAFWPIFPPLWLGSVIVALAIGALSYVGTYYGVVAFRRHRSLHRPARSA